MKEQLHKRVEKFFLGYSFAAHRPGFLLFCSLIYCWLLTTPALAQLQISYPVSRLVVQRGADGNGRLFVSGQLNTVAADQIEAQLTPVAAGQGVATAWQPLQRNPQQNLFWGQITGSGGWYVLTVRAILNGQVINQTTVLPVGIGEVLITAGQSNSRGLGIGDNDLGATSDRVSTIDTINHYYPPGNSPLYSSGDPMPFPTFKALTATKRIFPMGESSWGWGELGDYIVNRYNVPVVFYDAGWDSSTIEMFIFIIFIFKLTGLIRPMVFRPVIAISAMATGLICNLIQTSKTFYSIMALWVASGQYYGIRAKQNMVIMATAVYLFTRIGCGNLFRNHARILTIGIYPGW